MVVVGLGQGAKENRRDHLGRVGRLSKCGTKERGQLGVCVRVSVCCHLCERMSSHLCVCVCVCVCVWFTGAGQVADSETNVVTPLWIA